MAVDRLQSLIQLAVPSSAVDVPKEMSTYFQQVYSSLHTLQDALIRYCGVGSIGATEGSTSHSYNQIFLQGMSKLWLQAGVAISPGQLIGLGIDTSVNAGTQAVAVLADCTTGVSACAIYHGVSALSKGDWGEFWFFRASVTKISGLTAGQRYYLASGGLITPTAVTANGYISQYVGQAISSSHLLMDLSSPRLNVTGSTTTTFLRTL